MGLPPRTRLTAAVALSLLGAAASPADNWPQWRGPDRDGVWHETGVADKFPDGGLKVCWRAAVGLGYSSPVAARRGRPEVSAQRYKEVSRTTLIKPTTSAGKGQRVVHSAPAYADRRVFARNEEELSALPWRRSHNGERKPLPGRYFFLIGSP